MTVENEIREAFKNAGFNNFEVKCIDGVYLVITEHKRVIDGVEKSATVPISFVNDEASDSNVVKLFAKVAVESIQDLLSYSEAEAA